LDVVADGGKHEDRRRLSSAWSASAINPNISEKFIAEHPFNSGLGHGLRETYVFSLLKDTE
jgi:hypothetical protein